jgi:Ca2+-binding EF-hand superfamily protein
MLRDALIADCAVINAGNIRGNAQYAEDKAVLTYSDLKAEFPFDSLVAVVPLPGKVVNEVVAFTRRFALLDPPVEKGMFAQLDDGMTWSRETNRVLTIGGKPLDDEKVYRVAVLYQVALQGIDGVTPLAEYCRAHRDDEHHRMPTDEEAEHGAIRGAKQILVEHFSRAVWWSVVSAAGFDEIDADKSGTISKQELETALQKHYGYDLGKLVIDNLMSVANLNGDELIDRTELLSMCFMSASMFRHGDKNGDGQLTIEVATERLQRALGAAFDAERLAELFKIADKDGSGTVSIAELEAYVKTQERRLNI